METAVIIANWNGKHLLEKCLESLEKQEYIDFFIVLIDNCSTDGSVEYVKKMHPSVLIIEQDKNTGFAIANNIGIEYAKSIDSVKYIVTLNNDTIVDKGYLKELVEKANEISNFGSLQPKVINFFESYVIDSVGINIFYDCSAINKGQKEIDNGQFESKAEIFGSSASAALFSMEALNNTRLVNGDYFDSDYFAYYEDVDLAWRLRLNGYKSYYIPKAKVLHVHSATGKSSSPFKAYHIHRNHYYNIIKDMPSFFLTISLLFLPLRYILLISSLILSKGPAYRLKNNYKNKKNGICRIVFFTWIDVLKNFKVLIKKRKFIQSNRKVKLVEVARWLKIYRADLKKIIYN